MRCLRGDLRFHYRTRFDRFEGRVRERDSRAATDSTDTGNGQSASPADPLEQALVQARRHLDSAIHEFRLLPAPRFLEVSPDPLQGAHGDASAELVMQARRTVLIGLSRRAARPGAARAGLDGLRRRHAVGPTRISARLLAAQSVLHHLPAWATDVAELRVTGGEPADVVVVDDGVALTQAPGATAGSLLIRDRSAVRILSLLFTAAWQAALPWSGRLRLDGYLATDIARRVLTQLRHGATDTVAAQELGVSLRTYRRHVARILHSLGVRSRFPGGARAAELRLFDRQ